MGGGCGGPTRFSEGFRALRWEPASRGEAESSAVPLLFEPLRRGKGGGGDQTARASRKRRPNHVRLIIARGFAWDIRSLFADLLHVNDEALSLPYLISNDLVITHIQLAVAV